MRIALLAQTMAYLDGGGHFWVYLNWAIGLRANGCEVIWVESIDPKSTPADVAVQAARLQASLKPYQFDTAIALLSLRPNDIPPELAALELTAARAQEADLLINFRYGLPQEILDRFRKTALIDIDPGLLQHWVADKYVELGKHSLYFTTAEGLNGNKAGVPDLGVTWHSIHPCVALELWPVKKAAADAPFTTVSHWQSEEYVRGQDGNWFLNDKRSGFLPFSDLPLHVSHPVELALCIGENEGDIADRKMLEEKGWRIRHSYDVAGSVQAYHDYVQNSYGEFSACKPSSVRFGLAWVSDRTLCYLASGKPAVVQHTGPSSFLPESNGLWRFRTLEEAARAINTIAGDYENQCREARRLAETHFDASKVAGRVLDIALKKGKN